MGYILYTAVSRRSSVGIVTGLWYRRPGNRLKIPAGGIRVPLLDCPHTGTEACPISYAMGTVDKAARA